ncbi:guanine nucleotide-binding subunit alpha-12 isoform X2 [Labeo rohita]|uniref:Guanine nucleotide-binding subunit alpha-12 isoform X2 n=1 Tax=Labeo rohita TaxID=84645 RepID=A0A498LF14_LABRO|nr:guanine nucleotide-binding subunit alpha-12 isoform X2 [Labeo rohita]
MQWMEKSPKAKETNMKWKNQQPRRQVLKMELTNCMVCVSTFNDSVRAPPALYMFASEVPHDKSKLILTCLATGFYPKHTEMNVTQNNITLQPFSSTGVRPNNNQTFQMRTSVEINRDEKQRYECHALHSGQTFVKSWGERIGTTCIASFAIIPQTKTVSSDITSLTTEDQTIGRVFTPTVCVSSKLKVGTSAAKPKRAHSLPTFSPSSRLTVRHKLRDLPSSLQQTISKPTHQSPSQYPNRELQFESNAERVPLGDEGDGYQSNRSDASSLKLQRITEENLKLRETQQAIQADLKRMEAAKEELIQLLDRACSLQRHSSTPNTRSDHPSVTFRDAAYAGDKGWPEPPPPIAYDEPGTMSQGGKQELYSTTRATPTFTPTLTSVEKTGDSSHPHPYEEPLRYGQYSSTHVYPEQHRKAPYNVLTPMTSVDLTERYYKGPCPTIPYFRTRDPSEFARLKIALDNLLPPDSTVMFKYQVLVDHLKLDDACLIADSFLHSPTPYRDTMLALNERFGQPHQVALRRIATILDSPDISRNDPSAFERFSLQVQSLVGLLKTLGQAGSIELHCGSHVARLLNKLPPERRADFRRHMLHRPGVTYSLVDLAEWLKYESWCQSYDDQTAKGEGRARQDSRVAPRSRRTTATVLTGSGNSAEVRTTTYIPAKVSEKAKGRPMVYCSYCQSSEHAFSQCPRIPTLTTDQLSEWIRTNRRC